MPARKRKRDRRSPYDYHEGSLRDRSLTVVGTGTVLRAERTSDFPCFGKWSYAFQPRREYEGMYRVFSQGCARPKELRTILTKRFKGLPKSLSAK
jgi:hypothetical protein